MTVKYEGPETAEQEEESGEEALRLQIQENRRQRNQEIHRRRRRRLMLLAVAAGGVLTLAGLFFGLRSPVGFRAGTIAAERGGGHFSHCISPMDRSGVY